MGRKKKHAIEGQRPPTPTRSGNKGGRGNHTQGQQEDGSNTPSNKIRKKARSIWGALTVRGVRPRISKDSVREQFPEILRGGAGRPQNQSQIVRFDA